MAVASEGDHVRVLQQQKVIRDQLRKEAAEDGWNRMQAWFKQYGVLS